MSPQPPANNPKMSGPVAGVVLTPQEAEESRRRQALERQQRVAAMNERRRQRGLPLVKLPD
jgi:hypothetical protein